ncbi:hypothetical protein QFC22_000224 [Naganishia vaughanmartiniae]|uniref:Uncharacterized protein n=1 Tax=Naganishia vaughanmartiniae TaxID=1424756 RepID=A0ACC2XP90_9TREE|nr:hypothetical protein QFC22_000224 [Naganishia vaughanmartiniae]
MADVVNHNNEKSQPSPHPTYQTEQDTLEQEEKERLECGLNVQRRVPDYLQLHESVNSSTSLLDSLATFLATFQRDLSDVSGQIFELQNHSQEIDERSKGRKVPAPSLLPSPLSDPTHSANTGPLFLIVDRKTAQCIDLQSYPLPDINHDDQRYTARGCMVAPDRRAGVQEYAEPIGTPSSAELAAHALLLNRGGLGIAARSSGGGGGGGVHVNKSGTGGQGSDSAHAAGDRLKFALVADLEVDVVPGYEADNKEYVREPTPFPRDYVFTRPPA